MCALRCRNDREHESQELVEDKSRFERENESLIV